MKIDSVLQALSSLAGSLDVCEGYLDPTLSTRR